jgi:hypothetical protein
MKHTTFDCLCVKNDANTLLEKSDYFRAMFEHGTSEVTNRIIDKPGWTVATAESIICLIRESTINAKLSNDAMELFLASNEILVLDQILRRNLLGLNAGHLLTQEQAL